MGSNSLRLVEHQYVTQKIGLTDDYISVELGSSSKALVRFTCFT